MPDPGRRVRAAFLLAALSLLRASWPEPPASPPCPRPAAAERRPGRTLAVRCDGAGAALEGAPRLLFGAGLDPNTADAESLAVLPGIGAGRAAALVAARASAAFRRVEDLRRVPGIGAGTAERLRPFLVFGAEPSVDPPEPGK